MAKIPVRGKYGKGRFVIVDDDDYELIKNYTLSADKVGKDKVYVSLFIENERGSRRKKVRLHVFLMNPPKGYHVDHINGDTFDNRRSNLRVCTNDQNARNQKPQKNRTSKYKGVSWNKRVGKWEAYITYRYKKIRLGFFDSEEEAARAYDTAAHFYFGEFANYNFPEDVRPVSDPNHLPWEVHKTSQYRGVNYNKQSKKWFSRITVKGETIYLGYFDSEIDAAKAYDAAVVKYGLPKSRLNFPEDYPDYVA